MAIYVWKKYNYTQKESWSVIFQDYEHRRSYDSDESETFGSTYSIDSDGIISLAGTIRTLDGYDIDESVVGQYFDCVGDRISRVTRADIGGNYCRIRYEDGYPDMSYVYEKGSYIGTVTSTSSTTYPKNGISGEYWYVYKGTMSPPSAPSTITVPGGTIYSSTPVNISWSASTDPDGDLSGYELERQLDGSGSFNRIYRGSSRSYRDTIPTGTHTSVIYRVRAYDSEGNYSDYCTGPVRLIINNTAPSMPKWCSVPNPVKGGTSIKITWPASTDPDNNLAGYILERKFNSNSWTQIYKGANRSYTDPIPLDKYKTVTYRVKAYDTKNAQSAYATSATRTIQNSTVLQFRLKTPIESPKRARYGQEIMTYTIPSGATFKAEACNNGFDENPTWEDVTEFVKKQKIFEFANKTKTASKWGYDIRVTIDRNGATGNCYFTRGNGFFEEEGYTPPPFELIPGLGQTILLFGYNWLVCHDDGTNKYLITNDVLKTVQWNTTDTTTGGYAASQIKKECDVISANINANWYTQLVDTGNGKVFIPTYDQMNGGFSWFDSNAKRIAYLNGVAPYYWTATPAQSDRIWVVTNDGGFNYGYNPPTSNNGFRPAICVKYK